VSEKIGEAHLSDSPVADPAISLLSQPDGLHPCVAIPLPLRQSDSCRSLMSMQC
jgi:hypothetical protein